ncbi:Myb-related protein MYBAS1 [Frankliniella fusca]|uniref:Myb-related protein MYBAS1 n=1 Tax=Frankliniella fusca TaxID=407009 RepID=A0AAE1I0B2_9NEOP|nr:Myb-related protein MYBAS1 [Frankliniella fusca]
MLNESAYAFATSFFDLFAVQAKSIRRSLRAGVAVRCSRFVTRSPAQPSPLRRRAGYTLNIHYIHEIWHSTEAPAMGIAMGIAMGTPAVASDSPAPLRAATLDAV